MGPQSGNALLRHLHSVVHFLSEGESDVDFSSFPAVRVTSSNTRDFLRSTAFRNQCVDWYFQHFHKAYPLLHEGLFRAQYMVHDLGAVPKPKDGSWPVLCNMVLAVGAFAGPESATRADIFFSGEAQSAVSFALLQRGSVHLVQAFLLLANYLQKRNKPNSGFTLLYDARIE
ncbi:C6 transcription factor [Colletotrichum tofieldiae]|uniref:C6 transcription factor n=1 Tax=Colletotrichum tofieldiae TaxID=708197 RepID=A0A166YS68_9PEZI|nr:C6 transcription factor [Colletotrichum tofieldiae]